MNNFGPVHVLAVGAPDPDGEVDYEVRHPDECPNYETDVGGLEPECAVGNLVHDVGLSVLLGVEGWHEDDRHLSPGEYRIQAWDHTYDIPGEALEYDAGLTILA